MDSRCTRRQGRRPEAMATGPPRRGTLKFNKSRKRQGRPRCPRRPRSAGTRGSATEQPPREPCTASQSSIDHSAIRCGKEGQSAENNPSDLGASPSNGPRAPRTTRRECDAAPSPCCVEQKKRHARPHAGHGIHRRACRGGRTQPPTVTRTPNVSYRGPPGAGPCEGRRAFRGWKPRNCAWPGDSAVNCDGGLCSGPVV